MSSSKKQRAIESQPLAEIQEEYTYDQRNASMDPNYNDRLPRFQDQNSKLKSSTRSQKSDMSGSPEPVPPIIKLEKKGQSQYPTMMPPPGFATGAPQMPMNAPGMQPMMFPPPPGAFGMPMMGMPPPFPGFAAPTDGKRPTTRRPNSAKPPSDRGTFPGGDPAQMQQNYMKFFAEMQQQMAMFQQQMILQQSQSQALVKREEKKVVSPGRNSDEEDDLDRFLPPKDSAKYQKIEQIVFDEAELKKGVDPEVGPYQIDLDHPDSFNLDNEMEDAEMERKAKQKFKNGGVGDHLNDFDNVYEEDYGFELNEQEEDEQFYRGSASKINGNYDLDVIDENPDDQMESSGSKSKTQSMTQPSPIQDEGNNAKKQSVKKRTVAPYQSQQAKKQQDSEQFLKQMHTKQEKLKTKMMSRPKAAMKEPNPQNLFTKNIELSQMSEWTEPGTTAASKAKNFQNRPKIDENKLNSQMDREGLAKELIEYKKFALQQYEQIKLLKVEIQKIKRFAGISKQKGSGPTPKDNAPPVWATKQDSNLMRPKDAGKLQDEIVALKQTINDLQEDNKLLKANSEKYERRAKYTLEKFKEIKAKELQLIQIGEEKMKGEAQLIETKYKKKIDKQNAKIKELQDENTALKVEKLNQAGKRSYRVDLEKAQNKIRKLEDKIKRMSAQQANEKTQFTIQKQIANTMEQEEITRQEREAELEAEKSQDSKDLNNLIVEDGEDEFESQENVSSNIKTKKQMQNTDLVEEEPVQLGTVDYVNATLQAWNKCPSIVKKQMDAQHNEIQELKEKLKTASLKLSQRKQEFERHAAVEMKVELIKHKDKVEATYRQKLEDEKIRNTKKKVEEMDEILQENMRLKREIAELSKKVNGKK